MVVGEDFWLRIPMNNESAGRHLCMDDVEVIHAWLESGYGGCWTLPLETDGEQLEGVAVKVPGSRLGLGTYAVVMAGKFVNGGHFRTKRQLFIRLVDREEQADAKPTMFNEEKAYWAGPAVLSGMLSRDGLNTYELAVLHGYDGTLEQFLAQAGIELQDFMVTKAKLSREVQTQLDKGEEKGITPMGAYSSIVKYRVNDMVYDATTNSSYISLFSENRGHAVTDTNWWKKTFDGNYVLDAIMTAAQQTLNEAKAATEQATADAIAATEDATSATEEAIAAKNAANAVAAQKVAQAQIGYYECNSLATDATKVTTSGTVGTDSYVITENGGQMKIRMNKANSVDSNVKLQIGNTTALPLYYNGLPASSSNTWEENEVISVYYDGTCYQASNAQGGSNKKIDAYLYGDTKILSVGKLYKEGEKVSTVDKQLLVLTKDIKVLNLTDEIEAGDLRVYNNKTYLASEDVSPYSNATPYSDGDYALGRPSKMLITVDTSDMSVSEATTISVSVGGTTSSIDVNPGDTAQAIAGKIVAALTYITDWTISYNSEGVVTLKCKTGGANTLAFSYSDTGSTGIVVTSSATTGANTVSVYTADGDTWTAATLANYVISTVWGDRGSDNYLSIAELQEAATAQNSITKELDSIKSTIDAMVSPKKRVDVILRTTTSGESSGSNIEKAQLETSGVSITGPLLPADMEFDEDVIITAYGTRDYGSVTIYDENLTQLYKKKGTSPSYIGTKDTHWTPEQFKALVNNYPTAKYIRFKWSENRENNIVGHYYTADKGDSIVGGARQTRNILGSISNSSNIFWNTYKPSGLNKIDTIRVKCYTGTTRIYKVAVNDSTAAVTLLDTITCSSTRNGDVFEVETNLTLAENEYIGINCSGKTPVTSITGGSVYFCPINGGAISGTYKTNYEAAVQYIQHEGVGIAKFEGDIEKLQEDVTDINTDLATLQDDVNELKKGAKTATNVLFKHSFSNGSCSSLSGTQNISNGALTVGESHTLDKYYAIEERTIKYWCKFEANTVALFGFDSDGGTLANKGFTIDIPNMKIKYNPYNNNNNPTLEHMDTTHEYVVCITKNYIHPSITLIDLKDGNIETHTWTKFGSGGTGAGADPDTTGDHVGSQHDKPMFSLGSGSAWKLKRIEVETARCDYTLIMYGDSITEPEDYWPNKYFENAWTQLIIKEVERRGGKAVSSGRSSTKITELNTRIRLELPYVKAKYVMITIGTNGGNTVDNLTNLVNYIKNQGAIPILNHIPCNESNTQVSNNAIIDTVRANTGVNGCDFDLCTSIDGDGAVVDKNKMWNESNTTWHHPNVAGSLAMFAQTLIDVPEIYG